MGNISEAKLAKDLYNADAYIAINSITSVRGKNYTIHHRVWNSLLSVDRNPKVNRVEITMSNVINAKNEYGNHITFYAKTDDNGNISFEDFRNNFENSMYKLYSKLFGVKIVGIEYSIYRYGNQKATKNFKATI